VSTIDGADDEGIVAPGRTDDAGIVAGEARLRRGLALVLIAASLVTVLAGWLVLFQQVGESSRYLGLPLIDLLALSVLAQGVGAAVLGAGSYVGAIQSTPDHSAGMFTGVVVGLWWAVVVAAVATATFGIRLVYWIGEPVGFFSGVPVPVGLVLGGIGGVVGFLVTVVPREDLGATLPVSALLVPVSLATLVGPLDPPWTWEPGWTEAVFPGSEVLPFVVIVCSLLGAWSLAKAEDGFGAPGRQQGAYYLIGIVVGGTLGVLGLLIYFIVKKGMDTVLTKAAFQGFDGTLVVPITDWRLPFVDVQLPFIMNQPGGLFVETPGVWPAIFGTIWLVIGAVVIAVPMGIGAAVFLTEYVERGRITQVVEVVTNGLWSTPSIVFGLFGLAFLMPRLSNGQRSMIVAQVVLAFMLLPLVLITSREAILSVPDEYRDASAALGVSRWQTIRSVVLPAAMPGVITGVILGVGRIAGETAPLLLVFGGQPYPSSKSAVQGNRTILESFQFGLQPPFVTNDAITQAGTALPYQLYATITAGTFPKPDVFSNAEFGWGTALVLLLVVMGFYAIGVGSRLYFQRKLNYD
jgi:phosphate transport system permease protein